MDVPFVPGHNTKGGSQTYIDGNRLPNPPRNAPETKALGPGGRTCDVAVGGADVVDGQADAAGGLGDARALLEGVVDAVDAVVFHG